LHVNFGFRWRNNNFIS